MKRILSLIFCLSLAAGCFSQDPQFSQYYNAPLILNPAFAGATECYRAGLNARTQWGGLPKAFNTVSLFADLNYEDLRSGFGLMILHDNIGTPRLTSNEVSGFYSFLASFSDQVNFRFGLQGTYVSRHLDYSRLIFEDQFEGIVKTDPVTGDPIINYTRTNYADFSAGVLMFGVDKYWLGFSAHHLNQPDQAFNSAQSSSFLPIKYSVHGGLNFFYKRHIRREEDWVRIVPTFMYKAQVKFDQVDLGMYIIRDPIIFGAWYRGILVKQDENIMQQDALILHAGFQYNSFSFTYSYDITTSRLELRNTYGSHEISLIYLFCLDWPPKKKPHRRARKLPCPDFQRSIRYKQNYKGF